MVFKVAKAPLNHTDTTNTLVDLLRIRAEQQTQQCAYRFLAYGENPIVELSYGQLDRQVKAIARQLLDLGLKNKRAVLLYAPGVDFICAFFACLYAGVIAVPAYPPRNSKHLPKLQAIIADCQAAILLTSDNLLVSLSALVDSQHGSLRILATDSSIAKGNDGDSPLPDITPNDLAFLQYTSGSTGQAKGVMVTHANLMANQALIKHCFGHDENATVVGWLPWYHDMGLIGNIIQPLYIASSVILMSPMAFIEKPLRWLQAITDYRAHTSGGPNFAFELCVKKISQAEKQSLDLSCWTLAFNGAEPVQATTLQRFSAAFAEAGFKPAAFYPCYGLAEATLIATGGDYTQAPTIKSFNRERLEEGIAEPSQGANSRPLVSCGWVGKQHEMRIAGLDDGYCLPRQIGEIQLSGPSITQGYWQNQQATADTFLSDVNQVWLRTGDLGFIDDGELYVTGRLKDLIIIRGRNYYPQDIEACAEAAAECFNQGAAAAFSVAAQADEKLIVLLELKRSYLKQKEFTQAFASVRKQLVKECGIEADSIVLLKPGAILKTSSGKIRRNECKKAYEDDQLTIVAIDTLAAKPNTTNMAAAFTDQARFLSREELVLLPLAESSQIFSGYLCKKIQSLSGLAEGSFSDEESAVSLGLDSLKTMELKYFIDECLNLNFPAASLLAENNRVCNIAQQAIELAQQGGPQISCVAQRLEADADCKLAQGQQAIWSVCQLEPDTAVYNLAIGLQINTNLSVDVLRHALVRLIARHPQLCTGYRFNGRLPVQVQLAVPSVAAVLTEISGLAEQDIQGTLSDAIKQPFDLRQDIKLRAVLFKRSDDNYLLMLCVHHIAVDFRSLVILLDELKQIYTAKLLGHSFDLPKLTTAYPDFINWQQDYLASPQAQAALNYWQVQLAGKLPKLKLPYDRLPVKSSTYRGGFETFVLDKDTSNKAHALAKQSGVTINVLLLSVYLSLLYRYSGQQDLIVGSPTAGRPQKRFGNVVGYFVNPVAIRANPKGSKPFLSFMDEVKQSVLAALQHQDYPLSLLAEKLQPERDGSISPFYRVCFTLQGDATRQADAAKVALGLPEAPLSWPELKASSVNLSENIAQFDITLMMAVMGDNISASLQYRKDLFEAGTIQRMAGHYQCLLNAVLDKPSQAIGGLTLLPEPELQQQLTVWNANAASFPQDLCIQHLFEQQVARTPDAVALIYESTCLSYSVLNQQANRWAHYLIGQGIRPDDRVAVCFERSLTMVIGLLSVLKAGAAYVPLDPAYPEQRLQHMLQDCKPAMLLTQQLFAERLSDYHGGIPVVILDAAENNVLPTLPSSNPLWANLGLSSSHLAYIIYTSGSTGQPKGVMNQHQAVVNRLLWAQKHYQLNQADTVLQKTPFSFDVSVWEFFLPLISGARLVVAKPQGHQDPQYLIKLIHSRQVSTIHFVPSMLQVFLEQANLHDCSSLKRVLCSGEALPLALAKRFHAALPAVQLHNLYGPTEAAIDVTSHLCLNDETLHCVPIGRAIANLQIFVLDAFLKPVPIGVNGELYIGGVGLARGYFKRPDLTAERFIANPYSELPGQRLYRTGDIVRYHCNGDIEYLDRVDHQIKIRGFRIELGEIEACLLQHPAILQAAVLVNQDQAGDKFLVAYLATESNAPDWAALKAYLSLTLPDFMLPVTAVYLPALPLSSNGKLERNALASMQVVLRPRAAYQAPRDEVEQIIAEIWQQVLGVDSLSIHDDFFDLGGHSLSAVQIATRIKQDFAIDVPVKTVFEAPTIAEFVEKLVEFQND
ncbi:MAG: amino acid adenylation domain-containing protein [Methylococcaceae bacterium]|jgi:amino acid adenylation domain-containing protein